MHVENGVFVLTPKDSSIPGEIRQSRNASIRMSGFKNVGNLAEFPNISSLEVFLWPLESFEVLASLKHLQTLRITHFPKVNSLEALGSLNQLHDLELTTLASWYSKKQVVESLHPLSSLTNLQRLKFGAVLAKDKDLSPLWNLIELRELFVPNFYPQEQLARLAGRLPIVRRDWFLQAYVSMDQVKCKKCGAAKVMLSGSDIRPQVICRTCQQKKFCLCVTRYEEMVSESGRTKR